MALKKSNLSQRRRSKKNVTDVYKENQIVNAETNIVREHIETLNKSYSTLIENLNISPPPNIGSRISGIKPLESELLKRVGAVNISEKVSIKKVADDMFVYWLPMYLDSGKTVAVFIEKQGKEFVLSNNLSVGLEISLNKPNVMKDYVLKPSKFKIQKKELLAANKIEVNEMLEQRVFAKTYQELSDKLFHYAHFVKTFYNYVYNYILINSKVVEQRDILKNSVKKFLFEYCKVSEENVTTLDKDGLISNTNYYQTKKGKVISTANSRLRLTEMFLDFETLADRGLSRGGFVLMDISSKNHLTPEYIEKLHAKFKKYNIETVQVKKREDFKSKAYTKLKKVIA